MDQIGKDHRVLRHFEFNRRLTRRFFFVGQSALEKVVRGFAVARDAFALADNIFVPFETEPAERLNNFFLKDVARALTVGVFDPEQKFPLLITRIQIIE